VFDRSVDEVFGDRQNNAGAGVWLRECEVANPRLLLHGLQQFSAAVAKGSIDAAEAHARHFLGDEYLPKYLRQAQAFPDKLGGWPYSSGAMPETQLFLASGKDEEEAWELAAEHLLRMSVLPPADAGCARALVLVHAGGRGLHAPAAEQDLTPLKKGLAAELLSYLPDAVAAIVKENRQLSTATHSLTEWLERAESQLAEAVQGYHALKARNAVLEQQLDENQMLRRLAAIEQGVKDWEGRARGIESAMSALRTEVVAHRSATRFVPAAAAPAPFGYGETVSTHPQNSGQVGHNMVRRGSVRRQKPIAFYLTAAALVLVICFGLWKLFDAEQPSAVPTPATERPAAPAAPSGPLRNGIGLGKRFGPTQAGEPGDGFSGEGIGTGAREDQQPES